MLLPGFCRRPYTSIPLLRSLTLLLRPTSTKSHPQICRRSNHIAAGSKPFYITTPIFYPNAVPHIGHLYSIVTADIFARFARLTNPSVPVHFLTGTDEHGLKIQKAAEANGQEPGTFCDALSKQFRKLAERAESSHTIFARTTSPQHHRAVEHIWRELKAQGLIYKGSYSGWYSVSDECFYTSAQVTTLPASDTQESRVVSTETGSVVEWTQEENYLFKLSAFRKSLLDHYLKNPNAIFPAQHYKHVLGILSEDEEHGKLEDLSVSRPRSRLKWGIQVPDDPEHTIYVWIDALMIYLSGMGYPWKEGGEAVARAWPANIQVIGKDILRFHALYLPAMLQAVGIPLAQQILSHAHWTVQQKKMSKSVGNVIDPFEVMDNYGVDVVRYYFARVGGKFRDDADWSQREVNKYRDEITSYLGNFLLRITSKKILRLVSSAPTLELEDIIPNLQDNDPNKKVIEALQSLGPDVRSKMKQLEVAEALHDIVNLLRLSNFALTAIAPWSASPEQAQASLLISLESLRVAGICLQPFVPGVAGKLLDALGVNSEQRTWDFVEIGSGKVGRVKPVKLFE